MWKLLSFILRSEQRRAVFLSLSFPKTPTQIAKETNLAVSHISRTLREFVNKRITECKTPKEKIGKIYVLTEKGKKLAKKIEK